MNYTIIGTGAIGGFYGGRLMNAGRKVQFLLHSDYSYVRSHGLQIDSCDGSFHLDNVDCYDSTSKMPCADVILVGLKSTNNHLLKDLLSPIVGSNTTVVLIQNGIGLEEDLQQLFPGLAIIAGLAFICSSKIYSCPDDRFHDILKDMQDAGITAAEVPYDEARWKKAVWNMPFNGMTVALNTSTDKLLGNPSTRRLIYEQMMEVINAAQALGVKGLDSSFADKMIEMTDAMVPYSPSMKLDFDNHRPMEIPYLYSRPISEARKVGFDMSKLAMLEAELQFIQDSYLKK